MTRPIDRITTTAPAKIYLDLPEDAGFDPSDVFKDFFEATWSEDCATGVGIPYVRADLVPTPAASGAAPADWRPALHEARELAIKHGAVENDGMQMSVELYMTPTTLAKVIAEARARTALASPQVAPALTDMMKVWGMSAADLEAGPDRTSMDHYNKGVAAGIRQCIADCTRLATPVQVAPPPSLDEILNAYHKAAPKFDAAVLQSFVDAHPVHGPALLRYAQVQLTSRPASREEVEQEEIDDDQMAASVESLHAKVADLRSTAAPVAPQDDARDAARLDFLIEHEGRVTASRTYIDPTLKYQCWGPNEDEDYRYLSGEHEYFDTAREAIDAAIALSTPAAKPTEEQGS